MGRKSNEHYVTIVDPDRLAALERMLVIESAVSHQLFSEKDLRALWEEKRGIIAQFYNKEAEEK